MPISFKLKFQTSQTTHLDNPVVLEKIVAILNDKKYEVLELKGNSVTFGRPFFELVWRHEAPYILDGGSFTIIKSELETIVVLDYFIKTLYPLLISIALLTYMIIIELYEGLLFFGAFFLIIGFYQFFVTKNAGKKLLDVILASTF